MKNILTKNCATCGKVFEKKTNCSKKNWELSKFCSNPCINLGRSSPFKGRTDRWSEDYKRKLSEKNIVICSNTGRTHIKKGQRLSPTTEFKKGIIPWSKGKKFPEHSGEKNNNWKGGVTSEHQKIRHSPEMKNLRNEIFKRDDYTCKNCGRKRKPKDRVILQIHHIKSFAVHKELRFDKNNIVTLCAECHRKTDTYGKNL